MSISNDGHAQDLLQLHSHTYIQYVHTNIQAKSWPHTHTYTPDKDVHFSI